jgi:hypothetical protein
MRKSSITVTILMALTLIGCAGSQPLRSGLYGPVKYAVVVSEEKMVIGKHLSSKAKQELVSAKKKRL